MNPLIPTKPTTLSFSKINKSAGILDDYAVRKNVATKEGTIEKVPTDDKHIANKKYVDDAISSAGVVDWTVDQGATNINKNNLADSGNWDTAYTHSQDNTQAHSDYLLNSEADVGVSLTLTGDNSSADTAYVPMVLYNTDATPPAASGFPVGTIYIQYTP